MLQSYLQVNPNPVGYHVCLFCRRTFSSPSLYSNHINRPVARVLYRCHLCPAHSEAGPLPPVAPVLQQLSDTNTTCSGNLSAPNLCALYLHMAQWHSNEPVSTWSIVRSRLSVNAIPWLVGGFSTDSGSQAPSSSFTTYTEGQELIDLANDIDRNLT